MPMYLAVRKPQLGSVAEIAAAYGISENHLIKVAHRLGQLGFVQTTRGRGGGLRLGRPKARIVIGDVVRQALGEALAAFLAVLDGYTSATW